MNKYRATRIESKPHPGRMFASKLEGALFDYLTSMEKDGEISDIKVQVPVELTMAKIKLIVDFSAYHNESKERVFYESKGFETAVWRIKRRLWMFYGPGLLLIYRGSYRKLFLSEAIKPCSH